MNNQETYECIIHEINRLKNQKDDFSIQIANEHIHYYYLHFLTINGQLHCNQLEQFFNDKREIDYNPSKLFQMNQLLLEKINSEYLEFKFPIFVFLFNSLNELIGI